MSARALLSVWLPPLALMGLIFYLSAQPDLSSGLGVADLIGRKIVHLAEFGLLCALWWRALRTATTERTALIAAVAVTIAYAASDELHQTFVPERLGSPIDVAIDALGAALAAILIRRRISPASPSAERRPTASRAG